jgi:hypothetical protein
VVPLRLGGVERAQDLELSSHCEAENGSFSLRHV